MKTLLLSTASAALLLAGVAMTAPASAKGCIKGAAVGGIGGHVAGHGVMGAAAGCAVGHHMANKKAKAAQTDNAPTNNAQTTAAPN